MSLPQITGGNDQLTMLSQFLGVNKNIRIQDAEFSDMVNITNDYYPAIGNRRKRAIVRKLDKPQAILGGRHISWVDSNILYYDENMICPLPLVNVERKLVMMGAYLCVFPDGVIYNILTDEVTYMDNETESQTPPVMSLCKLDGTTYNSSNTITSSTEPTDKTKYWIDTSGDVTVIKMWSASNLMWVSISTTYVKFESPNIGKGFKKYDAVKFDGVDDVGYNKYDFNTHNLVQDVGDDYIIVIGFIDKTHTNSKNVTFERKAPKMSFICEQDNRLWGCSEDNHEIYASKLGDPTNWNCFAGLDSDSYAATVGTQNIFTGCISYQGSVLFFKEDGFHKLYGNKPSNYQMTWRTCRGVQLGSEKSLALVDEYLFWKSRDAVVRFDGSADTVSSQLGVEPLYEAVGGAYRNKYYCSMRDDEYKYRLYVYDINKNTWVIEDDFEAMYMANANDGFYMIDTDKNVYVVNSEKIYTKFFPSDDLYPSDDLFAGNTASGIMEDTIHWQMTTGDIGMDSPYMKYIKRIDVRLSIDSGAKISFEVEYDSSDEWEKLFDYVATKKRSYTIPIIVKRCDHMKLRMSGFGEVRIFSIAIVREDGSDGNI